MKKTALALFMLAAVSTKAQLAETKKNQIDSLLNQLVETKQFSGVVLVAKTDSILYTKTVGYADKEKKVNNQLTTNFNIASLGKTFTATLIMQLVQEGKLDLKQTVKQLLPEYAVKKSDSITVYHLLTHTSGVGNYMMHANYEKDRFNLKSLDAVMPYVTDQQPTLNYVGERFDYSNSGFIILGKIVEKITGKSYNQNLEERIFKKAGITNSYIHYPATFVAPKEATPYLAYTNKTFVNGIADEFPGYSDGGMQSNVVDLYRFGKALLNHSLLSATILDSMWNGKKMMFPGRKYAFGWMDNENPFGKHIYSHDGGGKGFSSDLKIVKEDGYIVAVLINNRVNPGELSGNILSIIYNGTYNKPIKYFENILMEITEEKGFDYVKNNYASILKEKGMDKTPSPWVYVQYGDMLENLKQGDNALIVYEMGRKEFPNETSMYNVTGQFYFTKEKYEEAVSWFNKALAIDPNDGFAKMMMNNIKDKRK